ncbi:inhibitory synaptic factor 2A [Chanos chanos]|uniref:Inhibitory synaptic factor 2A n=1 Tax=Chanos chanos TaxID=29144 RepID=A0A6J2WFP8_CHACN|nr:inhibitory synaptic factor 2A-like [Chanos chanos]
MVSKEAGRCTLSNSESDSESGLSVGVEHHGCPGRGDTVRKRNKALQVRFKDICEAQNEAAARLARGSGGRSASCKLTHRRYMTMPARRSIPNVTRSTAVQTSPDLKKRYQTFPFERKKGHTIKHTALVENYPGQNNGFLSDVMGSGEVKKCEGRVQRTRVLLHTPCCSAVPDLSSGPNCSDGKSCPDPSSVGREKDQSDAKGEAISQGGRTKHKGLPNENEAVVGQEPNSKSSTSASCSVQPLQDRGERSSKITGPIAWTSLTQVECPESPSAQRKREKDGSHLNGTQTQSQSQSQSQTLPRSAGCSSQAHVQTHCHSRHTVTMDTTKGPGCTGGKSRVGQACQQVIPLPGAEGDVKAQLQAMENLISSSQETIKVLLGVIQELEKGEAQREGLSYRTGQDTANCDTCRNSACIIYSVELDFKQQEDKLQPLMKRLCPAEDSPYPSLPYTHEVFTSTPKRKSKTEAKKHARWKLWFL